jgi:hypothetical protein
MWVAHFDGDDVGPGLELLLLDERIDDARAYSRRVLRAMENLAQAVSEYPGADVVVSGGDDLIVCWEKEPDIGWIELLRQRFQQDCARTLSVGVAKSARGATDALRRAKLQGKNALVMRED